MLTSLDLRECEKEPIHIPHLIQPHGFILSFDRGSLVIGRCSKNVPGRERFIGKSLSECFSPSLTGLILQRTDFSRRKRHIIFRHRAPEFSESCYDILVCDAGSEVIVEFAVCEGGDESNFVELRLNDMVTTVMKTQGGDDFFQTAAFEMRALTGYDRVMIYRFDEEFNGQVIAESHEPGMESYLGLHYPASDIPAQARELYRKNMIRTIVDGAYEAVPVLDASPGMGALDMSHSYLRSVSPIHLEYLKNMGVTATMTISIIVCGALWGLISCHHRKSYAPDLSRVNISEAFGGILGGIIQMREESEHERISGQLLARLDAVMDIVLSQDKNQDVLDLIESRSFLFQSVLPSDGFCVRAEGRIILRNFKETADEIDRLLSVIAPKMHGPIFETDHLASLAPDLPDSILRDCAGLLVLKLETHPHSWWIWRRGEKTQTITWSGDPNQKAILNQKGLISPRKSFEKYNEIVTLRSARWSHSERELAKYLISQIYRLFEFFESSHELQNHKKQIQVMEEERAKHYEELIEMLVGVIEQRDAYTAGHTRRVADYCVAIAKQMNLDAESTARLREAAILHDIGKVIIPDSVLLKPGKLSFKEYELIKAHLTVGYQILSRIDYYKPLAEIIRCHHEKYDGSGYPDGRKGEEISLLSHIMIVADAFDAMTTNRIYQGRKTAEDAIAELRSYRGKWYHPDVVDAAVIVARQMQTQGTIPSQLPLTQMEKERFAYFFKDQLTGVYNGTYLWMVINGLIPGMHCEHCLMIELHGMSQHNARFGWHEGNQVIRRFAEELMRKVREDQLFRVFGDDFVLSFDTFETKEEFLKNWKPIEIESVSANCRVVEKTAFLDILQ